MPIRARTDMCREQPKNDAIKFLVPDLPEGVIGLCEEQHFASIGIDLRIRRHVPVPYTHFQSPAPDRISMLDILMFNNVDSVWKMLGSFRNLRSSDIQ